MALWVCLDCTTAYAVGLFRCPRCHGNRFAEDGTEEAEMAKITRHGGASDATVTEEEVPSSPGTSSPASTPTPSTKPQQSAPRRRSRARTTANRSETDPTGSSTARSTDGDPTEPTSAAPADDA